MTNGNSKRYFQPLLYLLVCLLLSMVTAGMRYHIPYYIIHNKSTVNLIGEVAGYIIAQTAIVLLLSCAINCIFIWLYPLVRKRLFLHSTTVMWLAIIILQVIYISSVFNQDSKKGAIVQSLKKISVQLKSGRRVDLLAEKLHLGIYYPIARSLVQNARRNAAVSIDFQKQTKGMFRKIVIVATSSENITNLILLEETISKINIVLEKQSVAESAYKQNENMLKNSINRFIHDNGKSELILGVSRGIAKKERENFYLLALNRKALVYIKAFLIFAIKEKSNISLQDGHIIIDSDVVRKKYILLSHNMRLSLKKYLSFAKSVVQKKS